MYQNKAITTQYHYKKPQLACINTFLHIHLFPTDITYFDYLET